MFFVLVCFVLFVLFFVVVTNSKNVTSINYRRMAFQTAVNCKNPEAQ